MVVVPKSTNGGLQSGQRPRQPREHAGSVRGRVQMHPDGQSKRNARSDIITDAARADGAVTAAGGERGSGVDTHNAQRKSCRGVGGQRQQCGYTALVRGREQERSTGRDTRAARVVIAVAAAPRGKAVTATRTPTALRAREAPRVGCREAGGRGSSTSAQHVHQRQRRSASTTRAGAECALA